VLLAVIETEVICEFPPTALVFTDSFTLIIIGVSFVIFDVVFSKPTIGYVGGSIDDIFFRLD